MTRFRQEWRDVKRANKARLAEFVLAETGVELDPTWLFDIQVKRIHEYKRQHLNVLNIVTLYLRIKNNPGIDMAPAGVRLRRQGRARLLPGQAHHQADHRGRRHDQLRPRGQPVPRRWCSCPTSTCRTRT